MFLSQPKSKHLILTVSIPHEVPEAVFFEGSLKPQSENQLQEALLNQGVTAGALTSRTTGSVVPGDSQRVRDCAPGMPSGLSRSQGPFEPRNGTPQGLPVQAGPLTIHLIGTRVLVSCLCNNNPSKTTRFACCQRHFSQATALPAKHVS